MRAVVLERFGEPSALVAAEAPRPQRAAGELLVSVRACGVCGHDLLARRGALGTALPQVLGHEVAGEVLEGDEDGRFAPGDRVVLNQRMSCGKCAVCRSGATNRCVRGAGFYGDDLPGGYAEVIRAAPSNTVALPDALSFVQAAALPCGICTGLHALGRLGVQAGDTVLVTGAGGGVGLHAVALAHRTGARAIGVVRRAGKAAVVRDAGAETVIVNDDGDFSRAVRDAAGGGVDAVVECVGAPTLAGSLRALRAGGRVALVGNVDPEAVALHLGLVILKELELLGSSHATVAELSDAVGLVAAGEIAPHVSHTFPLADAAQAHALIERGEATGRVVLEV
ncbi:zinc-binding dehydrogenase [Baekduia soli]|uniref:alcohol dehydrogenase n=1 Tax=Baekduia soli TaxID=496014 RepID=A0A5B8UAT2_9ACTN|nr:alcohol dehydrogenase catalytic domain-containing protein [Baekduia soli]QEC49721.1 zinc-binding dehydrogenase [Baekduia soli]